MMVSVSLCRKPIERHACHMGLFNPWRVELAAESDGEQHWKSLNSINSPIKRLKTRRIDPMHILENHQHRLLACQRRELWRQSFQRLCLTLLRGQFERRIASVVRQRQHLRKQRRILA